MRKRAFRRAGRGDHIDLAAPGVNVWTAASISGARLKTGTSYATPFVTAAVALAQHNLDASGYDGVMSLLGKQSADLGKSGKDRVYGYGLLQADCLCGRAPISN